MARSRAATSVVRSRRISPDGEVLDSSSRREDRATSGHRHRRPAFAGARRRAAMPSRPARPPRATTAPHTPRTPTRCASARDACPAVPRATRAARSHARPVGRQPLPPATPASAAPSNGAASDVSGEGVRSISCCEVYAAVARNARYGPCHIGWQETLPAVRPAAHPSPRDLMRHARHGITDRAVPLSVTGTRDPVGGTPHRVKGHWDVVSFTVHASD